MKYLKLVGLIGGAVASVSAVLVGIGEASDAISSLVSYCRELND